MTVLIATQYTVLVNQKFRKLANILLKKVFLRVKMLYYNFYNMFTNGDMVQRKSSLLRKSILNNLNKRN